MAALEPPLSKSGSIEIENHHSRRHTITVAVTKTSDDDDDVRSNATSSPGGTPVREREYTYEIDAGESMRTALLDEPGAFYVDVTVDDVGSQAVWIGLYESRRRRGWRLRPRRDRYGWAPRRDDGG